MELSNSEHLYIFSDIEYLFEVLDRLDDSIKESGQDLKIHAVVSKVDLDNYRSNWHLNVRLLKKGESNG